MNSIKILNSYFPFAVRVAPAIKDDVISLSELPTIATELIRANGGGKLIGALLVHLAYEYGPFYARDLWKRSKLQWQQFVKDDVKEFIQRYVSYLKVVSAK